MPARCSRPEVAAWHGSGAGRGAPTHWQRTLLRVQQGLLVDRHGSLRAPPLQGNVDPVVLFGSQAAIEEAVKDCLTKVGAQRQGLHPGRLSAPGCAHSDPLRSLTPASSLRNFQSAPEHSTTEWPCACEGYRLWATAARLKAPSRTHPTPLQAGQRGHVLNLGHGVLVGTPEENVAYMFDLSKVSGA